MYIEMVIAEMRDRQSLMEYEKLFLEEIGPTLTALPGVQSAHVAAKKRSLFLVVHGRLVFPADCRTMV